ncbi:MAG TPA: hypothetical protein DEW39_04125 [Brevibacterium sp.]|uniref:Uncharacterized protein n=2 Tax=Brevibacterium TaxID=1696 RepID=A0A2H1KEI8_9MICO|nr:hypothetical protein BANT918_02379 [Brevibacterium antiquum CNRZ 918]HCG55343.1 hypothetical protein [Brevibacterium sp.]
MGGMREAYHRWGIVNENVVAPSELDAEFDRFIEQVRAEAWDEGYETGCSSPYGTATPSGKPYDPEPNPYRIEGKHE